MDFRELIKVFAERFHIRIEMKQIGARQEAGRIGGLGACGRELCCASWMSSFSSVTTGAARAQDISLNPQKLAGQCSKLKCCMMYEYDTYVDARKAFPRLREPLQTIDGEYFLVKTDILGGTMTFSSSKETMANVTTLSVERVKEILALNRAGTKVDRLQGEGDEVVVDNEPSYMSGSTEDSITRFDSARRRKKNNRNRNNRQQNRPQQPNPNRPATQDATGATEGATAGGRVSASGERSEQRPQEHRNRYANNGRNHANDRRNGGNNRENRPNGNNGTGGNRRGGNPNHRNGEYNGLGNAGGSNRPNGEKRSGGANRGGSSNHSGGTSNNHSGGAGPQSSN